VFETVLSSIAEVNPIRRANVKDKLTLSIALAAAALTLSFLPTSPLSNQKVIQTTDSMTFPVLEIVGKTATQMARTVDSIKLEMTNVMTKGNQYYEAWFTWL
jgi:hypothetical protein